MIVKSSIGKYRISDLKLLSLCNDKLRKGEDYTNYLSVGLSLSPNTTSGYNLCSHSTNGCITSCLFRSGMSRLFPKINAARIKKAKLFIEDRATFWRYLISDIEIAKRRIINRGNDICIRLNVISDIQWEMLTVWNKGIRYKNIFEMFPDIQFYDYTKIPNRTVPNNYKLTFSKSENNDKECLEALNNGTNVAVVFNKEKPLSYFGYQVIDGDKNDLRFLDPNPVIVGIKAKAFAKKNLTGFSVRN